MLQLCEEIDEVQAEAARKDLQWADMLQGAPKDFEQGLIVFALGFSCFYWSCLLLVS